jgi:hypothetical protein
MKAEFQHVTPDKLRNVWETIRPGLVETAHKAPGGWLPEDIYMSVKTGDSVLHILTAEKRYAGFLVSKTLETLEGRKLLLWIGYSVQGDLLVDNIDQLREWAQNIGAVKMQFQSGRKGWAKVAETIGFEPTLVIYESEV